MKKMHLIFAIILSISIFLIESMLHAAEAQNLPSLGDASAEDLSPLMEKKLGETIMLGIRADKDYIDDNLAAEYLNNFGSKLLEVHQEARGEANFDFYFFTIKNPIINAFALPGGFIGVYSALILTAQNESELASVLAHEIGHIAQHHIARMIGNQKRDSLIPIASMILAALTMRANPDAAMAVALGGEGIAVQRQLNFSQNAEREADRVGLQILRDAGYDPSGMVAFFERMQQSTRGYSDNVPAFLRTHPMTTERIADIQTRIQADTFQQHIDSPDFSLFRARIRVLQDESAQGLLDAQDYFKDQLAQAKSNNSATEEVSANAGTTGSTISSHIQLHPAAEYGLALIAFKQNNFKKAQAYLDSARKHADADSLFFTSLQLDILLRNKQNKTALKQAEAAVQAFPASRAIGAQYVNALIANQQSERAVTYLREQIGLYRQDFQLQKQLAKAYAAEGKEALQHVALAEFYALAGAISPALDQLSIARRSSDATYYDLAIIDARERDLRERYKEELDDVKRKSDKN
jgi:predicted Zn-dependent protease